MVVECGSGRERGGRGMLECNGVGRVEVGIIGSGVGNWEKGAEVVKNVVGNGDTNLRERG